MERDSIGQMQDRIKALESAIKGLINPGKYYDMPTYMKLPLSGGVQCPYCDSHMSWEWHNNKSTEGETHNTDCPVMIARRLLGDE